MQGSRPWRPTTSNRSGQLALLVAAFAVSRAACALAGVGFDTSALHPTVPSQVQWQLLPLHLLKHDLLSSVWNLHSQPPVYNLFCGLLLHLPGAARAGVCEVAFTVMGAAMLAATFLLLTDLGVRFWIASAVTIAVTADPAVILFEHWLSWSYPTAALMTVAVWGLSRFARTGALRWAAFSMAGFAAVVMTDPTYQWPWLVAMTAAVVAVVAVVSVGRRRWRAVALAAGIPLLLVAGWYIKDGVQFGTAATSSWLGMNLYHSTIYLAPAGEADRLVGDGTLSPIASVPSFSAVSAYTPRFVRARTTGVPALDERVGPLGVPNFNNSVYVAVSSRYLTDDLAYIAARPGTYAGAVTIGTELWAIPADRYLDSGANYRDISAYARWFDRLGLLEWGYPPLPVNTGFRAVRPPIERLSWAVVAVTVIDLLVAPVALWRRRADRAWLITGAAMWVTFLYGFVVTSLAEGGENMRFRFELGSVPLVLAVATVCLLAGSRLCSAGAVERSMD